MIYVFDLLKPHTISYSNVIHTGPPSSRVGNPQEQNRPGRSPGTSLTLPDLSGDPKIDL